MVYHNISSVNTQNYIIQAVLGRLLPKCKYLSIIVYYWLLSFESK